MRKTTIFAAAVMVALVTLALIAFTAGTSPPMETAQANYCVVGVEARFTPTQAAPNVLVADEPVSIIQTQPQRAAGLVIDTNANISARYTYATREINRPVIVDRVALTPMNDYRIKGTESEVADLHRPANLPTGYSLRA